ncbi:MAG: hypothetical protein KDD62_08825 [Bdellovibrionales bacterium]|nr:hypothetical protein [Bdellovibrionales bacterium]
MNLDVTPFQNQQADTANAVDLSRFGEELANSVDQNAMLTLASIPSDRLNLMREAFLDGTLAA